MKTLEEKKLLVKMAKALGQPVDPQLVESIQREENLKKLLFKEEVEPKIVGYEEGTTFLNRKPIFEETQVLTEAEPPPPPFVPLSTVDVVQQTVNVLNTANTTNANTNIYRDRELEGMRRTLAEMVQKVNTLSWGGGGTGIVRIWDADDLDRATVGPNKVVKFRGDNWFYMDTVTGLEDFTYGSFSDTTNQSAATANTPYEMRFNTTDASKGFYVRNNTEIVANTTGVYNLQFSAQLYCTAASLNNMWIWIRKNNQDVPNTATIISMSANKQYSVAAWNYFVDLAAGDHVHLMWAVDDTRLSIAAPGPTAFAPGVPSVILTMSQINT